MRLERKRRAGALCSMSRQSANLTRELTLSFVTFILIGLLEVASSSQSTPRYDGNLSGCSVFM